LWGCVCDNNSEEDEDEDSEEEFEEIVDPNKEK
jgi:hypothetical protein